jgi:hypothetical protein
LVLYDDTTETAAPDWAGTALGDAARAGLGVLEVEVGGSAVCVLESCNSVWLFDPARRRFRRVPRGARLDMPSTESDWTVYYRLDLDPASGAFSVGLNADDTRVVRSWVHTEACRHCASDQTGELSVEMMQRQLSPEGARVTSGKVGGDSAA